MWSEEFDKKARDAASNHSPSYDDKNWDRMESLLDKHLPVEKKKRRVIFWLLPLMMAIGVALYIGITKQDNSKNAAIPDKTVSSSGNAKSSGEKQPSGETISGQNSERNLPLASNTTHESDNSKPAVERKDEVAPSAGQISVSAPIAEKSLAVKTKDFPSSKNSTSKTTQTKSDPVSKNVFTEPGVAKENKTPTQAVLAPASIPPVTSAPIPVADDNLQKEVSNINPATTAKDSAGASSDLADNNKTRETAPRKKPKQSNDKGMTVGIAFGPDISGLGMNKTGSWQMQYGLSVGYAFSKRFSLRTGFFASRKIYTADPGEYHPPYNFWVYYPRIEKIDANCLVYEIPITAVYNFPSRKKDNWFVSTGVSSYLMKDETYEYYYKNAAGVSERRTRTIKNENSHLFSVINLSGGYSRNFSKRFYLMAEPYLKIPVSGVGYGNVKLNSGGILFTVGTRL